MKHIPWSSGKPDYRKLLNPDALRQSLQLASLFVFTYETLKDRLVERPQELYSSGFDQKGIVVNEDEHQARVLTRDKSPVRASFLWFIEMGALTTDDLQLFDRLRNARNAIVHELPQLVSTGALENHLAEFAKLIELLRKLEVWWVRNLELEFNDDFVGVELEDDEIIPGTMLMIQMMFEVSLGEGDEAWKWYRGFFPDSTSSDTSTSQAG